jgi:signal peptidase
MLLVFFSRFAFGYIKNKKTRQKDKIRNNVITISFVYLAAIYLLGKSTSYQTSSIDALSVFYLSITLILMEVFRYIFLNKCSRITYHQYLITILFILFDILIVSAYSPAHMLQLPTFLTLIIITVVKESVLTYLNYKFAFFPCVIYSLIITILPMLPLYPKLGNYLSIVFTIIYSSVILYNCSKPFRREEKETANTYKRSISFYFERILLGVVVLIILLVSGLFKYNLSAIASDSMYPALKKGDAVLIEKVDDKIRNKLKKGDIVAFEEDNHIITHRILSITEENEKTIIITKGDNNSTKDVTKKTKDDIIGIVRFKIPLIGYPSIEISDIKSK